MNVHGGKKVGFKMLYLMSRVSKGLSILLKKCFSLKIFQREAYIWCNGLKSDVGMGMMGRNDAPGLLQGPTGERLQFHVSSAIMDGK